MVQFGSMPSGRRRRWQGSWAGTQPWGAGALLDQVWWLGHVVALVQGYT